MKLEICIKCPHYISHSTEGVECKFYLDQIMERTLVAGDDPWILDCPCIPEMVDDPVIN
jgi:hypothetical protein